MRFRIPINPFKENEESYHKNPSDMSLEELELLLYSKRLNLKLDVERLHKKINYTKIFFDFIDSIGLTDKILDAFNQRQPQVEPEASNLQTNPKEESL
ncbi:MAG: hypothetical protein H7A24_04375 [Leptospiraceae bacterium]|nr:hypothetical protein [Leptospiraceae bacterium]MCP5511091.1 hypothetical protein [Leptospiraceae bacterium]